MQTAITFWDKIADRYSRQPIRDMDAYTYTLDRTRSYLSREDRALELGCGTGGTARLLAPSLSHITATDISPKMIQIAQQRAKEDGITNASFATADLQNNLPAGGPYDIVLAHNLFHLIPDTEQAIAHVSDLVQPGGLFISKTPCLAQPGLGWKIKLMLAAIPVLQAFGKAPVVRSFTISELENMITKAGFSIVETGNFPASPPNRYIVARKD